MWLVSIRVNQHSVGDPQKRYIADETITALVNTIVSIIRSRRHFVRGRGVARPSVTKEPVNYGIPSSKLPYLKSIFIAI